MRIVCPACAAAYDVPDDRIGIGRVVRCARCATDWVPRPDLAPIPEPVPAPEPPDTASDGVPEGEAEIAPTLDAPTSVAPAPVDPPPDPAPRRAARLGLAVAWIASVAVILAGLAGAVTARERVMKAWPPSIRAYHALGLK